MDTELVVHWSSTPLKTEYKADRQQIFKIPLGALIVGGSGGGGGGTGAVDSVNGKTGVVVLNYTDVGADQSGTALTYYNATNSAIASQQTQIDSLFNTKVDTATLDAYTASFNYQLTLKASNTYVDTLYNNTVTELNTKATIAQLDTFTTQYNTLLDAKANINYVDQQVATKADLIGGKIPASQLPSFVDDVLDGNYVNTTTFNDIFGVAYTPADGVIYVDVTTNKTYRWGGSSYVITGGGGVALGETSETAYRGDRGKLAYDHSVTTGNPHGATTTDITEGSNLYFTGARVRSTVLSGLVTNNSTNVTNTDTVEVAIGKLQAKSLIPPTVTWVDANTLTGYVKHTNVTAATTKVQLAVINGMIWMRGHLTLSSSVNANTVLFSYTDSRFLWDNTYLGTTADNQFTYDKLIHNNIKIQDLAEFRLLARQIGTGTAGNITNTVRIVTAVSITSDINYAIIEPVCLGIAKNP